MGFLALINITVWFGKQLLIDSFFTILDKQNLVQEKAFFSILELNGMKV